MARDLSSGPPRDRIERFLVEEGREYVEQVLLSERCLSRGLFRPDALRTAVRGAPEERLGAPAIFALTSLELWARANIDSVSTHPPTDEDELAPVVGVRDAQQPLQSELTGGGGRPVDEPDDGR